VNKRVIIRTWQNGLRWGLSVWEPQAVGPDKQIDAASIRFLDQLQNTKHRLPETLRLMVEERRNVLRD
jgi:hypothetical protein